MHSSARVPYLLKKTSVASVAVASPIRVGLVGHPRHSPPKGIAKPISALVLFHAVDINRKLKNPSTPQAKGQGPYGKKNGIKPGAGR